MDASVGSFEKKCFLWSVRHHCAASDAYRHRVCRLDPERLGSKICSICRATTSSLSIISRPVFLLSPQYAIARPRRHSIPSTAAAFLLFAPPLPRAPTPPSPLTPSRHRRSVLDHSAPPSPLILNATTTKPWHRPYLSLSSAPPRLTSSSSATGVVFPLL
jgi:hypothetical protein